MTNNSMLFPKPPHFRHAMAVALVGSLWDLILGEFTKAGLALPPDAQQVLRGACVGVADSMWDLCECVHALGEGGANLTPMEHEYMRRRLEAVESAAHVDTKTAIMNGKVN